MADLPKLQAVFFRTSATNEPVREWLLSLERVERRQIGIDIGYVQFKWPIGKPKVDNLRDGIWEVRSRLENRIARILFAVTGNEMVLLHGFIKKTRKTSDDDLKLAEKRWKEWQRGESK
ncbi:MAG: type II toxin-antitoxin system RelE/ParE family toxin [Betaproteobacteria bacterium]|nr:type II toxin-antitoxin system RelE/ParE family toxin [Betaproteobacteria bacterium]